MSIYRYTYNYIYGDMIFDFVDQIIYCENTINVLDMQGLINGCREAECSEVGVEFPIICRASGKNNLDTNTGVQIGITLELLGDWRIYSQKTSGKFVATAGNLIQGGPNRDGDPFEPNNLVNYISIQSAASTIVNVSTGSGLSNEEHVKLMSLSVETLTVEEHDKLMEIPSETLTVEQNNNLINALKLDDFTETMDILIAQNSELLTEDKFIQYISACSGASINTEGLLTEERFIDLNFNRNNTVSIGQITEYVAGDDVIVKVDYDIDGYPIRETVQ